MEDESDDDDETISFGTALFMTKHEPERLEPLDLNYSYALHRVIESHKEEERNPVVERVDAMAYLDLAFARDIYIPALPETLRKYEPIKFPSEWSLVSVKRFLMLRQVFRTNSCLEIVTEMFIYEVLVKVFIQLKCEDFKLLHEYIEIAFENYDIRLLMFHFRTNTSCFEHILLHTKSLNQKMWDSRKKCNELTAEISPVNICLQYGTAQMVKILLSYGYEKTFDFYTFEEYRKSLLTYLYGNVDRLPFTYWSLSRRAWLYKNRKRLMLIMEIFTAFTLGLNSIVTNVQSLRWIWRSIPDPFITPEEMLESLLKIGEKSSNTRLENICISYKNEFFPESEYSSKPRSLLHLSRCGVRACLRRNSKLPEGIDQLNLPTYLDSYLKLDA